MVGHWAGQPLKLLGRFFYIRHWVLCTCIWFDIVDRLVVNILLGITYMKNLIEAIFPMKRRVLPIHSMSVAILSSI